MGNKQATMRRYKPDLSAPSWRSSSATVVPSVNMVESNYPARTKVDGLTITPDGEVKGKLNRRRRRVLTVDGVRPS